MTVISYRAINTVEREEGNDKKSFQEEVIRDPTLQDKLSILTRTFHNKRMVISYSSFHWVFQEHQFLYDVGILEWTSSFFFLALPENLYTLYKYLKLQSIN